MSVGTAVLLSRLRRGMSREELGAEAGRDGAWVEAVEEGARTPGVLEIAALADALGWSRAFARRAAAAVDDGVAALEGLPA